MISSSIEDKLVKVWSIENLECINMFKIKGDIINCIKIHVNKIINNNNNKKISSFYNPFLINFFLLILLLY